MDLGYQDGMGMLVIISGMEQVVVRDVGMIGVMFAGAIMDLVVVLLKDHLLAKQMMFKKTLFVYRDKCLFFEKCVFPWET